MTKAGSKSRFRNSTPGRIIFHLRDEALRGDYLLQIALIRLDILAAPNCPYASLGAYRMKTKWIIVIGAAVCLGAVGYFAAIRALNLSLADGKLARLIAQKTAVKLRADTGYLPLAWTGASIRSAGILVRGQPPRALAEMSAVDLRAFCSLQNLWQRKWTITHLEASYLQAAFGQEAATHLQEILPSKPILQPQLETPSILSVEIQETVVPRTDIFWGETPAGLGWLKDVAARFYPRDRDLDIVGQSGTFRQTGWPELKVDSLRLHYATPKLAVRSASFLLGPTGKIGVNGDFDFGDGGGIELTVQARATPVEPFLNGFWRGKLEGVFDSDSRINKLSGPPVTGNGEVRFARASVHRRTYAKTGRARHTPSSIRKIKSRCFTGALSLDGNSPGGDRSRNRE